jgi:hypothetical protein
MKSHVHKYRRVILGSTKVVYYINEFGQRKRKLEKKGGAIVFKCMIPGCSTWRLREIMPGEKSICWNCNEELTITSAHLDTYKPVHEECKTRKPWATKEAKERRMLG